MGIKDRDTNKVVAKPVPIQNERGITGLYRNKVAPEAKVYTDDHKSYIGLPFDHESVNHSVGEYVREQIRTG